MKPWAEWFYKSKAWKDCRDGYYLSQHGICQRCGAPGKIVHHKEKLTSHTIHDPSISLNWENLELLCQTCHNVEHHGSGEVVAAGLRFDSNGDLIQR